MYDYYLDPRVTSVHRLPAHAGYYTSAEHIDLNGEWMFRLFDRPEECKDSFIAPEAPEGFSAITVPGNWQLQGFGKPIYTNYVCPWPYDKCGIDGHADPWRIPEDNPTGCYRKHIMLDTVKPEHVYIIRFEGVETAYELYVNGNFAGYAEDSKLTSEFDITPFLRSGDNLIALKVYAFATSIYLEDQDYWYLNGIFRPVTLLCMPKEHITDIRVKAVADRYGRGGSLTADVSVSRVPGYADHSVKVTLTDADGREISSGSSRVNGECGYESRFGTMASAHIEMRADEIIKWFPERPYLYGVKAELTDASGNVVGTEFMKVGFKRVDIEHGILLLNGMRAEIFGVNRHEHAWKFGRAVPEEHMRREIAEMKKMNINAVRTCHYPDSDLWYSLCDELGIWVLCECDLETHAVSGAISHDASFAPAYVERAQRMVAYYANHACIYGWSLGNESGYGPGHAAMYGLVKQYDDTRICQYEAGNPGKNISDIRGQMYATENEILRMLTDPADDRPVILVEYLYQIRSAGGGMRKFIDLMRKYPRFQGGFIWDWQDKSLPGMTEDGTEFFAHGGDLNDAYVEPHEPLYMTNNGIVRADLVWKPAAYDVREAYSPVLIEPELSYGAWSASADERRFTVYNRSRVHDLGEYEIKAVYSDGTECPLDLPDLKPCESHTFVIGKPTRAGKSFIEFTVTARYDCLEKAHRQFMLSDALEKAYIPARGAVSVSETEKYITLSASGAEAVFDRADGSLVSYTVNGKTVARGSGLALDRPYCGLDAEKGWGWRSRMDEARSTLPAFEKADVVTGTNGTSVISRFTDANIAGEIGYTMDASGRLSISLDAQTAEYFIPPRIGIALTLPGDMSHTVYTGYGPHETYSDRLVSAVYGTYETDVADLGFDYAPPSENGGREGVTKLAFAGTDGKLGITSTLPFHFDARTATVDDIKKAAHTHEVPARNEIYVHLDAYHMPIGGDMAWSTMLSDADIPHARHHALRVTLQGE